MMMVMMMMITMNKQGGFQTAFRVENFEKMCFICEVKNIKKLN